eukprot:30903-Pelagococcus_subviridis.AAC.4
MEVDFSSAGHSGAARTRSGYRDVRRRRHARQSRARGSRAARPRHQAPPRRRQRRRKEQPPRSIHRRRLRGPVAYDRRGLQAEVPERAREATETHGVGHRGSGAVQDADELVLPRRARDRVRVRHHEARELRERQRDLGEGGGSVRHRGGLREDRHREQDRQGEGEGGEQEGGRGVRGGQRVLIPRDEREEPTQRQGGVRRARESSAGHAVAADGARPGRRREGAAESVGRQRAERVRVSVSWEVGRARRQRRAGARPA